MYKPLTRFAMSHIELLPARGLPLWRSSNNPKANWKRCGCSAFFCFAGVSGGAGSGDDDLSPCARAASSSPTQRSGDCGGSSSSSCCPKSADDVCGGGVRADTVFGV